MVINMNETHLCTNEQVEQFLGVSAPIDFSAYGGDLERYAHIAGVLKRFGYRQRNKHDRGVLLRYRQHTNGYSRALCSKYTSVDIELPVEMDKAHEDVCGPARQREHLGAGVQPRCSQTP